MSAVHATEPENPIPPEVQSLLSEFDDRFCAPSSLPPHREDDHTIPLIPGAQPVSARPYRYTPQQKDEIEKQIKEMLRAGIIRPSSSPFAAPVLLVRKKDGTWRFCVDYRQLNAITVKNKHPMPVVDEMLDEISGAKWFTKLDLLSGYHQIRVADEDVFKTAFRTHQGLYEFLVMPFGLSHAPGSFQSMIHKVLNPLLRHGVLAFMNDILVHTATLEEHLRRLREVLQLLRDNELVIKRSKCAFAQPRIEYLRHVIGAEGVATDPAKVEAVQTWPIPISVRAVRGFLGLTGYYRKFIQHYGVISRPVTELLKKGKIFQWTQPAETAFQLLKKAMIAAPVLAVPNFQQTFVLETDACKDGIGAVLMQQGHPVAYLSKGLCLKNQALSTYEKECLAILMAVDKWRPYLQHQHFIIRTDQQALLHLADQRLSTGIQHKAFVKLM